MYVFTSCLHMFNEFFFIPQVTMERRVRLAVLLGEYLPPTQSLGGRIGYTGMAAVVYLFPHFFSFNQLNNINQSMHLSISLSIYLSINLSIYLSVICVILFN